MGDQATPDRLLLAASTTTTQRTYGLILIGRCITWETLDYCGERVAGPTALRCPRHSEPNPALPPVPDVYNTENVDEMTAGALATAADLRGLLLIAFTGDPDGQAKVVYIIDRWAGDLVEDDEEEAAPPTMLAFPTDRPAWLGTWQSWPCGRCRVDVDAAGPHECTPTTETTEEPR